MNFGELKELIAEYLHRDDLTDRIPTFIELGQSRMNHDLDLTTMQTTATLPVTASIKEVTLPADFLRMLSVRIPLAGGGFRALTQRSLVQNSQVYESTEGATETPRWYARYGKILELSAIPESDTTLEIIYEQRLAAFVDDSDTDEVLTDSPNIYIYSAMLEASPFLIDDTAAVRWEKFYSQEVVKLNELSEDEEWSGSPLQIYNLGVDTP